MILAIDTATRSISIALHDGVQVRAEHSWRTRGHHTQELSPALAQLMGQVGVTPADLSAIAVPSGPGSYTGLRIGMAVAKGIALSANLPLIGVPTLHIIAAAQPHLAERLAVATQAGRKRINAQIFAWAGGHWHPADQPFITTWEGLVEQAEPPCQVAGEIDANARDFLSQADEGILLYEAAFGLRRAGFLAELAYQQIDDPDDAAVLAPFYLS